MSNCKHDWCPYEGFCHNCGRIATELCDDLEAENKRLREALQHWYDYGYDRLQNEAALQDKVGE